MKESDDMAKHNSSLPFGYDGRIEEQIILNPRPQRRLMRSLSRGKEIYNLLEIVFNR
jgi:hypothetical protein